MAHVVTKQNTGCHDILVEISHAVRLPELAEPAPDQGVELETPKGQPCAEIHVSAGARKVRRAGLVHPTEPKGIWFKRLNAAVRICASPFRAVCGEILQPSLVNCVVKPDLWGPARWLSRHLLRELERKTGCGLRTGGQRKGEIPARNEGFRSTRTLRTVKTSPS